MSGARVSSGPASEQVVATPRDFLDALEMRFGRMRFDLAATKSNSIADEWYGTEDDSLSIDWSLLDGNLWLNPPYGDIGPWAQKCAETRGPRIFLLVPLTTAKWATEHVWGHARAFGLTPRLKFVGHASAFPKDLMLAVYGEPPGFEVWRWKP
jgi:phage N-6-adenine-methyltransferase